MCVAGWAAKHNTWEPPEHIPPALIREFEAERAGYMEDTSCDEDEDGVEPQDPPPGGPAPKSGCVF